MPSFRNFSENIQCSSVIQRPLLKSPVFTLDFVSFVLNTNAKSTLTQVMAWCRQRTSHNRDNVDPVLCRHMALLGHSEFNNWPRNMWLTQGHVDEKSAPLQVLSGNLCWKKSTTSYGVMRPQWFQKMCRYARQWRNNSISDKKTTHQWRNNIISDQNDMESKHLLWFIYLILSPVCMNRWYILKILLACIVILLATCGYYCMVNLQRAAFQ